MGRRLREALQAARSDLETGLSEAEAELRDLEARRNELQALIAQAKAALGSSEPAPDEIRRLTLHEAIAQIIRENGNDWVTARELAHEVNARGLYRKRDGSPVELNQIHARTKNYADLFEKEGSRIRLRKG